MEKYLDTEEPKEREPGIRLEYQLKTEEVYGVLKRSKFYRKAMLKAKIETAVLGAMTLLFGLTWLLNEDINAMIFAIASAVFLRLLILFLFSAPCTAPVTLFSAHYFTLIILFSALCTAPLISSPRSILRLLSSALLILNRGEDC